MSTGPEQNRRRSSPRPGKDCIGRIMRLRLGESGQGDAQQSKPAKPKDRGKR